MTIKSAVWGCIVFFGIIVPVTSQAKEAMKDNTLDLRIDRMEKQSGELSFKSSLSEALFSENSQKQFVRYRATKKKETDETKAALFINGIIRADHQPTDILFADHDIKSYAYTGTVEIQTGKSKQRVYYLFSTSILLAAIVISVYHIKQKEKTYE